MNLSLDQHRVLGHTLRRCCYEGAVKHMQRQLLLTGLDAHYEDAEYWGCSLIESLWNYWATDKQFLLDAVQRRGACLQWTPQHMRADAEVVLAAVKQDSTAFEWSSKELRDDKSFVLAVVKNSGGALKWASRRLRCDEEVIEAAIGKDWSALKHVSTSVWFAAGIPFVKKLARRITNFGEWLVVTNDVILDRLPDLCKYGAKADLNAALQVLDTLENHDVYVCHRAYAEGRCRMVEQLIAADFVFEHARIDRRIFELDLEEALRFAAARCDPCASGNDAVRDLLQLCNVADNEGLFESWIPSLRRVAQDCFICVTEVEEREHEFAHFCVNSRTMCIDDSDTLKKHLSSFFTDGFIPDVHQRLVPLLKYLLHEMEDSTVAFMGRHCRVYSPTERCYGTRGGFPYMKPAGFVRFAIDRDKELLRSWPVAYHGTTAANARAILRDGMRRPPGGTRQAGSRTGRSIYFSPCPEYAAFPTYSSLFELGDEHWAQCLVQARIRPGSFRVRHGTLGSKHWPRDLAFDSFHRSIHGLEWLVEDENDVVVVALLVREFGKGADPMLYGRIASNVADKGCGPEYDWSSRREHAMREQGLSVVS